jgi:hypothetical protein
LFENSKKIWERAVLMRAYVHFSSGHRHRTPDDFADELRREKERQKRDKDRDKERERDRFKSK